MKPQQAIVFQLSNHSVIAMYNDYDTLTFADLTGTQVKFKSTENVAYDCRENGEGQTRWQDSETTVTADSLLDKHNETEPIDYILALQDNEIHTFTMQDLNSLDYDKVEFLEKVIANLWQLCKSEFQYYRF